MTLDGNAKAILDASARAIVSGRDDDKLDLSPLNSAFQRPGGEYAILTTLTELVEHHSGGNWTIRRADAALFQDHVMGINLYLVLCPSGTSEGTVTELDDDMVLVSFGPYSNGFNIGAKRASRERVEDYRALAAKSERNRQARQHAERVVETFLGKLTEALKIHAQQHGDSELLEALERKFQFKSVLALEDVAYFATAMDIPIESLVGTS